MYKLKNFLTSKIFAIVASFVGLFLISAGISTLVFSYVLRPPEVGEKISQTGKRSKINLNLPKTEECPINGQMFTKPEKEIWETRRPVTAIVENHLDSRPQSGLSRADVVYEAVAEGGITRFLAVFYCGGAAEDVKIAPVRSARIYFVNLAAGYGKDPIFLHQGGANNFCNTCPGGVKPKGQIAREVDAYAALDKLGWRNGQHGSDMDGGFNVGYPVVIRDQYRLSSQPAAWEHSVVASLDEVYNEAKKRGFEFKDKEAVSWNEDFKVWKFTDDKPTSGASSISFSFWDGKPEYNVEWKYDSSTNSYKRFNGGSEHLDLEFGKPQLSAKNVVILFAKEKGPVDAELHLYYEVIGEWKALVFQNGEVIEGKWVKRTQLDREVFYDNNGRQIQFVRGPVWIAVVPAGNTVSY